jgi:hypothetical protein
MIGQALAGISHFVKMNFQAKILGDWFHAKIRIMANQLGRWRNSEYDARQQHFIHYWYHHSRNYV